MAGSDTASDLVKQHIRQLLCETHLRMTPTDLVTALSVHFPEMDRKRFRTTIRTMVSQGILAYTHHFSSTHIEMASGGAMAVSERLSLNAPITKTDNPSKCLNLMIQSGSAFGRGDHPTTLLSLKAIAWIAKQWENSSGTRGTRTLDIGTGTGVLAMAAVLLGSGKSVGLDIDRLACREAMHNIRVNGLQGKVHIVAGGLDALGPVSFDMIMANLRPPTLVGLMAVMARKTVQNGYWVLSGFRPEEQGDVLAQLPSCFHPVWTRNNRNWSAIAVRHVKGGF